MPYCADHKDCQKKLIELCGESKVREERIQCLEEEIENIQRELWLSPNSLRQRIKGVEDADMHLEKIILDNRKITQESLQGFVQDFNDKLKGMFKIFVLTITAASILIMAVFSVVYWEARSSKTVVVHKTSQPTAPLTHQDTIEQR